MKNYLCFLFCLVVYVTFGTGQRVGNPDDTAKIERPCPTFDQNCIRDYIFKHAYCKKAYGSAPDPLLRPQNILYVPSVNLTISLYEEIIRGINGRIEEFYINRDTDKMVIAIEYRNLSIASNETYFRFHRRAKEPVVTFGNYSSLYQSVVITAVIPKINNLQLDKAECVAFTNDERPDIQISESAYNSTDPQPTLSLTQFFAQPPLITVNELFLNDASYYIAIYIQKNLCDFGLTIL